ncbi:MFS transporter [Streptomyces tubbatahanensis]|uniref:MFS transporter n=1 Tax=Streptomyces tubbatahanensis TaxID=2923272 RepID=A0ABY3XPF3_9ACTN|nr:MFS transporter [Streptomyces tubbatahanensis]UNS96341.1 MFS transporter [Streptomyces tubbatahanensis]
MASVLALDGADKGTVSAMAGPLGDAFGIGYAAIGLLVSVVAFVGAAFTVPFGLLTDRVSRTRLLALTATLWGLAMIMAGAAMSYLWLLVSRAVLGAVTASSGPAVNSLVGDYFPARQRARMLGFVVGGELLGTALGFAVSGVVGSALGWRYAFWWLTLPTAALVWALVRLPEPPRGRQKDLRSPEEGPSEPGGADNDARAGTGSGAGAEADGQGGGSEQGEQGEQAGRTRARVGAEPDARFVLHTDPRSLPPWRALVYVLRIPTNLVLIVASALGYFFFSGLRAFATVFTTDQYGVSTSVASSLVLVVGAGGVCGVLLGGRAADRLLERGRVEARVLVPTVCLLAVPLLVAPALHTTSLAVALPLLLCGTAFLGAVNPPLDAARLDIMPHMLWGTAEGARTVLRTLSEAMAPTLLGYLADHVFTGGHALEYTLFLSLVPLLAAALIGALSLRTYPRDVATAAASTANLRTRGRPA